MQVWIEHMKDLARAVDLVRNLDKELNADGQGHSDLYFDLQEVQIPVRIDGIPTGWSVGYSYEMETWVVQFGEEDE